MLREATFEGAEQNRASRVASLVLKVAPLMVGLSFALAGSAPPGASAAAKTGIAWRFPSDPGLEFPKITVSPERSDPPKSGQAEYLFFAPIEDFGLHEDFVGKAGPQILEPDGDPVWEDPLGREIQVGTQHRKELAMDFHTATYDGQRVLVWWQGHITPTGYGSGWWEIVSDHYERVARITAPQGFQTDFHAFEITASGMAYLIGWRVVQRNLTCCGGSAHGQVYDQVVFQTNIKTGQVLWTWDPLAHIPLQDSYLSPPSYEPWDPYHLNSISVGPGDNLVVAARNTWAAYWILRGGAQDGQLLATLGGKHSSFRIEGGAHFSWQHDVSYLPGERLSVFADEASPPEAEQSRGVVISLDWDTHVATLVRQYLLPHPALAGSQGSVQMLANGDAFVGWGQLPYFSEYDASGKLLYLGSFQLSDESYRTYKGAWIGLPLSKPLIAVGRGAGGTAHVGASWNGATEVASWQLLTGANPTSLAPSGEPVPRSGFETHISSANPGPYFAVRALGAGGKVLGTSRAMTP